MINLFSLFIHGDSGGLCRFDWDQTKTFANIMVCIIDQMIIHN